MFAAVPPEIAREFGRYLLTNSVDMSALVGDRSILHWDTFGTPWHVFDADATVKTLRQRGLPRGSELPEPVRLGLRMAAPGYSGRKRGEVQVSRMTLQHAGSRQWLGAWLSPGNSSPEDFAQAVLRVRDWCECMAVSPDRVMLRFDGCAVGVPALSICLEHNIPYLTRLSQYHVLRLPQVEAMLAHGPWERVADSGSGPTRWAMELGSQLLTPSSKTRRPDGSCYQPLETRVVVSRFAAADGGHKRGCGEVIGNWQYELYTTPVTADLWPAPETVSMYYGRVGEENNFGQEDRELQLDRTISYEPPGQEVAVNIGMFVWNLRLLAGKLMVGPTEEPVRQTRREIELQITEDQQSEVVADTVETDTGNMMQPTLSEQTAKLEHQIDLVVNPPLEPCSQSIKPKSQKPKRAQNFRFTIGTALQVLTLLLTMGWSKRFLSRYPCWRWDEVDLVPICPAGHASRVHDLVQTPGGNRTVRFRVSRAACRSCFERSGCTTSKSRNFCKEVKLTVPPEVIPDNLLTQSTVPRSKRGPKPDGTNPATTQPSPSSPWRPPNRSDPGRWNIAWPMLIPSELRRRTHEACRSLRVTIHIEPRQNSPNPPEHLARSPAEHQRRRHTFEERLAKNRLPEGTRINIEFAGEATELRRLLREVSQPTTGCNM